jgi:hypothetical protein
LSEHINSFGGFKRKFQSEDEKILKKTEIKSKNNEISCKYFKNARKKLYFLSSQKSKFATTFIIWVGKYCKLMVCKKIYLIEISRQNWTVEMVERFVDQKLTLICKTKDSSTNILLYRSQKEQKEKETEDKKEKIT